MRRSVSGGGVKDFFRWRESLYKILEEGEVLGGQCGKVGKFRSGEDLGDAFGYVETEKKFIGMRY